MNNFKIGEDEQNPDSNQFMLNSRQQNSNNLQAAIPKDGKFNKKFNSSKIIQKKKQVKKTQKSVEDNPEYFRVDNEISHKLFEIYRRLKIGPSQQSNTLSFSETDQLHSTMNYHKIIQIFKDLNISLEINQKLQILRAIKKFCFNQNFINEEEFMKIFKVIVHGIAFKQSIFKPLIAGKYQNVKEIDTLNFKRKGLSIKINKKFVKKLKTEPEMDEVRRRYQANDFKQRNKTVQTINRQSQSSQKKEEVIFNREKLRQSNISPNKKIEHRKRMLTNPAHYESPVRSYLSRAIEKNKLGKITWQNLFKMTEDNMHHYISIPNFINKEITDDVYF